jgi:hypothetical protein
LDTFFVNFQKKRLTSTFNGNIIISSINKGRSEDEEKTFLTGGSAVLLTFGRLAGCGDEVDQDNGVSDEEKKEELDNPNS